MAVTKIVLSWNRTLASKLLCKDYPESNFFWHAQEKLENLDPECHALWTHLESRLETF